MSLQQFLCELSDLAYDNAQASLDHEKMCAMFFELGEGCTRWVFKITYEDKAYAIKFAIYNRCTANNRREARAWRKTSKEVRAMMAEVHGVSTCGRVLAMELVPETLGEAGRYGECGNWNEDLRRILEDSGFTPEEASRSVADNHTDNIGVRANGDIVWLDYAVRV